MQDLRDDEVYLDHNATTPVAPEVVEAMLPFLHGGHGNPSCGHRLGREARAAVEDARRTLSQFFGCARDEVVFTSGGTESNNLAIKGAALARMDRGRHVVIGAAEHPSVADAARWLTRFGFEVSEAPCTPEGQVTPEAVRSVLRPDTVLVSVMHAQNVVGTISRIDELAEALGGHPAHLHTDAAQSVGKIPTAFPFLGADLMTIAGHKLYGPKGVGALIVRRRTPLEPLLHGAGHEGGRRCGTENTAGIVGLAAAVRLAQARMAEAGERMVALRDALHLRLATALRGVLLNGHPLDRLPNTLNLSFLGTTGRAIADRVPSLLLATGPACHDRADALPPALRALGIDAARGAATLRLSLGRDNTWDEVDRAADLLVEAVVALRRAAGVDEAALPGSDLPRCPRCEVRPLRLELTGLAPAAVCQEHPACRYEAYLAAPAGVA